MAIKPGHWGTGETQRCYHARMDLLTGAASEVAHEWRMSASTFLCLSVSDSPASFQCPPCAPPRSGTRVTSLEDTAWIWTDCFVGILDSTSWNSRTQDQNCVPDIKFRTEQYYCTIVRVFLQARRTISVCYSQRKTSWWIPACCVQIQQSSKYPKVEQVN